MKNLSLLAALLLAPWATAAAETRLPIIGTLGTGPAMDVAVDGLLKKDFATGSAQWRKKSGAD